jgi:macrolide transport system ATP-binding/permease protein
MRFHAELAGAKQFGNVTLLKEEARAMWTWMILEQFLQDLRYAWRAMNNNRAFTLLAALSLALGIGANAAIYSIMDAILWRSLPVNDPESLVLLNWHGQGFGHPASGVGEVHMSVIRGVAGRIEPDPRGGIISGTFPYAAFERLRTTPLASSVFSYFGDNRTFNVKVKGQAEMAHLEYVSGDYFRGLGAPPAAGRLLLADDDRPGAPAVAVVSYSYGQKRFGEPAQAVGTSISVNNVAVTVVGVAPPEFFGVDPAGAPELYVPMHTSVLFGEPRNMGWGGISDTEQYLDPHFYWLQIMLRLRPGVSREQAQATLAPIFHEWVASSATDDKDRAHLPELVLTPGAEGVDSLSSQYSKPLFVLWALVAFILVIACTNIVNLLLARATARRREMAVRLSIGAGRLRVVRQLLTESVLLASLGGALGILIAIWGMRFLTYLMANGHENFTVRAELNWHVLAVAAALSVLTGILFGLVPAIQSTRADVVTALKDTGNSGRKKRLPALLVPGQIAVALLMLVAADLFTGTLSNLQAVQVGFNRENLLLFEVNARLAGHREPEIFDFYRSLQRQFEAIPGVRSASLSVVPMMGGGTVGFTIRVRGKETPISVGLLAVGPSFLQTMQIPILSGYGIEDRGQAVAAVNERFVEEYFAGQNPLGEHIQILDHDVEIVGVCANARYGNIRGSFQPLVYYLYNRTPWPPIGQMTFELRTAGNPLGYVNAVREIVRKADPGVPVTEIKTQAAKIDQLMNQEMVFSRLSALFAILGLAITCVGLYGTIAYRVSRRTSEIGIRMALGAQRGSVLRMILREVLIMLLAGFAIGLPAALGGSRFVESFLFGIKANDPRAIAFALAILASATLAAGYAPARRASRIDPMTALRHE